jgi:hypothetical protein
MNAKTFLAATVCHLTVTVALGGDARVTRESGKTVWTGSLFETSEGLSRLVPGDCGMGPRLSDKVRPEMARALESALDAAYDVKYA